MGYANTICASLGLLLVVGALGCGKKSRDDSDQNPSSPDPKTSRTGATPVQGTLQFPPLTQPSLNSNTVEGLPFDLGSLDNLKEISTRLNLESYRKQGYHGQNIKIAIFDNGFAGLNHSLGKRLPPNLSIEKAFDSRLQASSHGTKMAEIVYAVASGSAEYREDTSRPEIYLFNTNGFSNFQAAINRAIELKIDMILYAQVWEFGGQFDGYGFINNEVSKATDAGILWVNASGNAGLTTYSGELPDNVGSWIGFKNGDDRLKIVVPQDGTATKIVLSWSDFKETKNYHTDIDLDLMLEDSSGKRINESRLAQTGIESDKDFASFSSHARETLESELKAGTYYIRAQYVSKGAKRPDFEKSKFRVTVTGMGIRMDEGTPSDSLPIPADHRDVLAVGAWDVDYSGQMAAKGSLRSKPDLWLDSKVEFDDPSEPDSTLKHQVHYGTSAASALAVGALAVYQSAWGKTSTDLIVAGCRKRLLECRPFSLPKMP